jgi:hypothetical protein
VFVTRTRLTYSRNRISQLTIFASKVINKPTLNDRRKKSPKAGIPK